MNYSTPTSAAQVFAEVRISLQDPSGVRWGTSELLVYLNRAQMDIHRARPDTTATVKPVALRTGVRQTLPAEAASLIDIPCNTGGAAITKVNKYLLDSVEPNWRARATSPTIRHFMHDMRSPREFEVFPPAGAGARVDIEYSAYPEPVAMTGGGLGNVSLGPQWVPALSHLILYYAWSKDAEYANNAALAASHLARAEQMLGVDLQTTATVAPKE